MKDIEKRMKRQLRRRRAKEARGLRRLTTIYTTYSRVYARLASKNLQQEQETGIMEQDVMDKAIANRIGKQKEEQHA